MERETGIIYPNSPTIRVGSDLQNGFKKVEHPKPMFTIENTYDTAGFNKWCSDMWDKYKTMEFNVSIKYDGVSCELWYENGMLVKAVTRGDKNIGDDITENVKTIKNIPLVLPLETEIEKRHMIYIRGEILMPKSKLKEINEQRTKDGLEPFANTRNACSGSIKQLDPKVTASRGLIFKAWDIFYDNEFPFKFITMEQKVTMLENLGFYYEDGTRPFYTSSLFDFDLCKFKEKIDAMKLDYDYDGLVIKLNDITIQDEIGTKDTRALEWAIARKWNEDLVVETVLRDIDWQVGRTGVLTPVGRLDPIECNGVIISNVTLHNLDFINSMSILIGDVLKITRSGGVIPYVIGSRQGMYGEIPSLPKVCPVCGAETYRDGALIKCSGNDCSAKLVGRAIQFCSRDCMDIRGVGEKVAEDLCLLGIINSLSDFYSLVYSGLTAEELSNALGTGYGVKSCQTILDSIRTSMTQPLSVFLSSLSIPGVGKTVGRLLEKEFKTLDNFMSCTKDALLGIDGIGDIMANDIYYWTRNENNIREITAFKQYGYKPNVQKEDAKVSNVLNNLKVCFTGSSSRFSGDEVETFLESLGAKCASVSKSLNYLITGAKPGPSKVKKATDLGVEVITEEDFYKKFNI